MFYNLERDVLLRLKNNEGKLLNEYSYKIGFPKILDSGYDNESDVYYIAMNKLDEDLNQIIKRSVNKKL